MVRLFRIIIKIYYNWENYDIRYVRQSKTNSGSNYEKSLIIIFLNIKKNIYYEIA